MSITRVSIQRPVAVAMLFIAVACLGALSFTRLPIDLLPDIAYPKLVVYTSYPDVAPAEVERFVTEPLERQIATVPGIERMESATREGASLITLRFAWGTDMDFAALNVRERVDALRGSLPEQAHRPVVLRTDPRAEPIIALSVAGAGSLWSLKELTESVFRRRLEQIDGVAQAAVTGGLEREIHVTVDPQKLESYGVTLDQISGALARANASAPSGTIRQGRYRYNLRTLGELQAVAEIADLVVAQAASGVAGDPAGRILVRDVATVEDGFRERESIARHNGREAIGLLIYKESGTNTVRVAEQVDEVLAQLRAEYPEVDVQVAMSQAGFIAGAIANLVQEMVLGALLAFLVLVLFLRDARYPVAISLAIPISVIATFALLHATGVSLNIMSLGGLALGIGMLVDNSIVVIENIFRHREKGLAPALAAAVGTDEVRRAITASTLTTIAVFGPIIYVEGVAGELFAALSFAVAFSLLASLVVAVVLLPTMAARWDGTAASAGRVRAEGPVRRALLLPLRAFDRGWNAFAAFYHAQLELALRHRGLVVLGSVLLLAITIPVALSLDRSVLPAVDQGEFRARLELPRGTPLETTAAVAEQLERLIGQDPDVAAVFSRIGRQTAIQGIEEEQSGLHTALLEVKLHRGRRSGPVIERVRARFGEAGGARLAIETGHGSALGKLLGAGEADLAVRLRGDDLDASLAYAAALRGRLAALPEVTNVRVGAELGQPEYRVEIDRERAAAYGIDAVRIADAVEQHMRGVKGTDYVAFDRKVPVMVRLPEAARRSLATLQTLQLDGIPLRELVHVHEALGPVEIRHLDQGRIVPVFADAVGRDIDQAVAAVRQAVAEVPPPDGIRIDIGGENEEMRRSFRELGIAFALAVLLVYMILAAQFESLIHPFTVLLSVPLGLVGAIFALWAFGAGINSVSLIGLVILVGIVDNDAVVKIDFINQMRREGLAVRDAIRAAGRDRLRPIVMNSLTAMLAILPMMLGIGPGAGLQAPLAIAVFGGLFTATALTLIVIPVIYELFDELPNRVRAWRDRDATAGHGGAAGSPSPAATPASSSPAATAVVPTGD
ncbi:MAG TPA: efflux RND transporter permease subunit [Longimicrobiales bacterium]|nr:efflux RND transporter permease subunit [Longimicrobiales bacterium]